jgi:hypothetical protein
MINRRPFSSLPKASMGWLQARHHFPVDGRPDRDHMPVKSLYVWNDDQFAPGHGFPLHHHRDVEIISYIRSGVVTHGDTLGNTEKIRAGDIQVISAGTGVRHSEINQGSEPLKIYQIWLEPNQRGGPASYSTRRFPSVTEGAFSVMASGFEEDAAAQALPLRADARLLAGRVLKGASVRHELRAGRDLYMVPATGAFTVNGILVETGDGVAVSNESLLEFNALEDVELVLVELA